MPRTIRALTADEVRALPASAPLWPDAARALGVGRTKAYAMIQSGEWPTRLLKFGHTFRVPTSELLTLLGITDDDGPSAA